MRTAILAAMAASVIVMSDAPSFAQTGRIDPKVGDSTPAATQVQFRRYGYGGGSRWRGRGGYGYRGNRGYGYGVGAGVAGLAAGALIGGAIAAQAAPAYGYDYAPAASQPMGDDTESYCIQRFKSYDPGSGTYLGYDGLRHSCP